MKFTSVFDNNTSENTYLVFDENTGNGLIIDPGCSMEKTEKMINENNVNVKYILLTHCHYDHISSLIPLKEKTGALIVTGDRGNVNIGNPSVNLSVYGLGYEINNIKSDKILSDGEVMELDTVKMYIPASELSMDVAVGKAVEFIKNNAEITEEKVSARKKSTTTKKASETKEEK